MLVFSHVTQQRFTSFLCTNNTQIYIPFTPHPYHYYVQQQCLFKQSANVAENILNAICTKIPIHFTKSIHLFSLFKSHFSFQPVSTPHTSTSRRFFNMPCNNNDISYITTHHITQYCSASRAKVRFPIIPTRAGTNSVRSRWSYYRCFDLPDLRYRSH